MAANVAPGGYHDGGARAPAAALVVPVRVTEPRLRGATGRRTVRIMGEHTIDAQFGERMEGAGYHYPLEVDRFTDPKKEKKKEEGASKKRKKRHDAPEDDKADKETCVRHRCQWCRWLLRRDWHHLAEQLQGINRTVKRLRDDEEKKKAELLLQKTKLEGEIAASQAAAAEHWARYNVHKIKPARLFCCTCTVYLCGRCWGAFHQIPVPRGALLEDAHLDVGPHVRTEKLD
jgi:hypothetical protein